MWRWPTAAAILVLFVAVGVIYWFVSGYKDPAGTVLLIFMGPAMGFGYWIIFRGSPEL